MNYSNIFILLIIITVVYLYNTRNNIYNVYYVVKKKVSDVFNPPEKTYEPDHSSLNYGQLPTIATTRYNLTYQEYGYLYREQDGERQVIKLYGRKRQPNVFDYYGLTRDSGQQDFKVAIDVKNREILDGDLLDVPPYVGDKFKAYIYKDSQDPLIYYSSWLY